MLGDPYHGLAPDMLRCPGLPDRYRTAHLAPLPGATDSQRAALAASEAMTLRLLSGKRRASLVLLGSPGVGKSHMAAGVCNALWTGLMMAWRMARNEANAEHASAGGDPDAHRRHVAAPLAGPVWVNVPSLLVDVKAEMSLDRGEQQRTSFARWLRHEERLVVLDDLGRERVSEWTGELLYVIVNDRYEAGLPTIATSNLTVEELVASGYWPAISRLAEDGRLVEVKAPDHRLARRAS